ncbi:MAG: hypothetical protein ABI720_13275, partial [Actinomycetes bacterium]
MYTRRNSIESSAQHWVVLFAALITSWMAWRSSSTNVEVVGAAIAIGLFALNAVVVTALALRAVRRGQSLVETMRWESVTTYASLLVVALIVATTGGLSAPALFLVFLWAPYLGMSMEIGYTARGLLIVLIGSFAVAGWYTQTWSSDWQRGLLIAAALAFVTLMTYFYASDLYAERFTAEQMEAQVSRQVEQISQVLVQTARGDLSVGVAVGSGGEGSAEELDELAVALDETIGSLRGLVSRVRVGGEQ